MTLKWWLAATAAFLIWAAAMPPGTAIIIVAVAVAIFAVDAVMDR